MQAHKKAQAMIGNFIVIFMAVVALYFGYQILSPIITQTMSGQSDDVQFLEVLVIPTIIFCFIIVVFKIFKKGDNPA